MLFQKKKEKKESYHKQDRNRLMEGILTYGKNAISCFDFP